MPISFYAVELGCYAFALYCFVNAWKQSKRWFITMIAATFFGLGVELYFLYSEFDTPGTYYTYGDFLLMIGWSHYRVPLWVGLGWASIAYASIWSAERLPIPIVAKALLAGLLAINIDLSLDPVAELLGFWTWHNVKGPNYYGVPFDNFLGWLMIVGTYALSSFILFDKIPKNWKATEYWVPFAAIVPALLLTAAGQWALNYIYQLAKQQAIPFVAIAAVSVAVTVYYGRTTRRDLDPNWCALSLPIFYDALLLILLLFTGKYLQNASLLVIIPVNFCVALTAFAWSSLDRLLPPAE